MAAGELGVLLVADDPALRDLVGHSFDVRIGQAELLRGGAADGLWDRVTLVADSVAATRAALPQLAALDCRTRNVEIVVGGRPRPGLLTVPARSVGGRSVVSSRLAALDRPTSHTRMSLRFGGPAPLRDVLAAVLEGGPSAFAGPLGGLRLAIQAEAPEAMRWACGDPAAVRRASSGIALPAGDPSPVDLVLADRPAAALALPATLDLASQDRRPSWRQLVAESGAALESFVHDPADTLPAPVDTDVLTPIGFVVDADPRDGRMRRRVGGERPTLVISGDDGHASSAFFEWSGLTERVVDEARRLRAIRDDPVAHTGPVEQASFLAQAACAALPVVAEQLSGPVRRMLGEPLADALTSATAADFADPIRREQHCMTVRRLAFDRHGARRRWRGIAAQLGLRSRPPASVSVVLATRRPELLARIAEQVVKQDWPQLELVVGAHSFGRDHPLVRELEKSFPLPLAVAEIPVDRTLGEMLNDLCALASGEFVAKMDDDDWYSPHHITDLVHAAEYSRADLVGGGAEFLYLEALNITVRRQRSSGHRFASRVPGATLLMSREKLRAVGGWRPIHRAVDTALARAVADSGGSIYRAGGLNFVVYRAAAGHTWDPGLEYFLRGDVQQWPGFAPPPDVAAIAPAPPPPPRLPASWFERSVS